MTSCQLPKEDREIWSQRCVAYETFSILVPDNDLNLLKLLILLLNESKHSRLNLNTVHPFLTVASLLAIHLQDCELCAINDSRFWRGGTALILVFDATKNNDHFRAVFN